MRRSNLHLITPGDNINLERALLVGDRLGGHMVSGHIDGKGTIIDYTKEDNAVWVTISTSPEILKYIVQKGSIAIDGISLTVASVDSRVFKVSIIPHTKEVTTLLRKRVGDIINLECDMLGKYIEKLFLSSGQAPSSAGYIRLPAGNVCLPNEQAPITQGIDMKFLCENGFA